MQYCLMTFLSRTQAGWLNSAAKRAGLSVSMLQAPKALSRKGCTVAVRFPRRELATFSALCRENGISYSRVFSENTDAYGRTSYKEISV